MMVLGIMVVIIMRLSDCCHDNLNWIAANLVEAHRVALLPYYYGIYTEVRNSPFVVAVFRIDSSNLTLPLIVCKHFIPIAARQQRSHAFCGTGT